MKTNIVKYIQAFSVVVILLRQPFDSYIHSENKKLININKSLLRNDIFESHVNSNNESRY